MSWLAIAGLALAAVAIIAVFAPVGIVLSEIALLDHRDEEQWP